MNYTVIAISHGTVNTAPFTATMNVEVEQPPRAEHYNNFFLCMICNDKDIRPDLVDEVIVVASHATMTFKSSSITKASVAAAQAMLNS
jgi:hypothetical protein